MDHSLHALSSFLLAPLLGCFPAWVRLPSLALARLFCVVICQEVVQACKATSSCPEVGLLSGSSYWRSSVTAGGRGDGVSQAGGWEDPCWGWVLISSCAAAMLGCPSSLLSSQFLLTFSPCSLLTLLFSPCFFSSGRKLRGKAFYFVNGKVFCEEDFLVSTQLTLVLARLSLPGRHAAFLPVSFACILHSAGPASCLALLLHRLPRISPSHGGCPHVVLEVTKWEATVLQCRAPSRSRDLLQWLLQSLSLRPCCGGWSEMNGYRRMHEWISLSSELGLLGHLNGYLCVALNGFCVNVPEHEATPRSSPWLVAIKSHIPFCPWVLRDEAFIETWKSHSCRLIGEV